METFKIGLVHTLEKVFPDERPRDVKEKMMISALRGETISFQLVYYLADRTTQYAKIKVESLLEEQVQIREVKLVPSNYPCHIETDKGYLRTAPGMYPDLLRKIDKNSLKLVRGQWRSLWIDVDINDVQEEGIYELVLKLLLSGGITKQVEVKIEVIKEKLEPLQIKHTEWFHGDCLADYYKVDVFSERHWDILEHFIETAAKRDCNMILTPIFTPPLDTQKGGDRTTIQLITVKFNQGIYDFDFSKFEHWVKICKKHGIKYFEMSHLFTQWGAIAAPKIMATVDGEYKQLFGWQTEATDPLYQYFLKEFLTTFTKKLHELSIAETTFFHISDEPSLEQVETYQKAYNIVKPYLKDFSVIDALSDYEFYKKGIVNEPVCAINHIEPFLINEVKNLWSYYCTAQNLEVSNRFMSMPSFRNRIYGAQVYKYGIKGILHWGYNFYNSEYSLSGINPYEVTDADCAFPSGDPFLVYPGDDGYPEESIRLMVHYQAMTDIRAMSLLEKYKGKDYVVALIEEVFQKPLTFNKYPDTPEYCLELRERINQEIKSGVGQCKTILR